MMLRMISTGGASRDGPEIDTFNGFMEPTFFLFHSFLIPTDSSASHLAISHLEKPRRMDAPFPRAEGHLLSPHAEQGRLDDFLGIVLWKMICQIRI